MTHHDELSLEISSFSGVGGSRDWEAALMELTQKALTKPSSRILRQLAECYHRLGEHFEARILADLANSYGSVSDPE